MNSQQRQFLTECSARYRKDLLENIMPFWLENGLDHTYGGIFTCLDRDGTIIDHTKSVWFQGRFAYTCSLIHNQIDQDPKYLAAAKMTLDFIDRHCFDSDGHMFFEVKADGCPVRRRRYIFSECFAVIAMAEYSKATSEVSYADKALRLFKYTLTMMETPGFLPAKYLPTAQSQGLSPLMILINTAKVLKQVSNDPILDATILKSLADIETYFVKDDLSAVLEMVGPKGEVIDTCVGRMINPGHVIELAWFILDVASSMDKAQQEHFNALSKKILDWSWAWGWDDPYGGIINFRDCHNLPVQEYSQDMKFWWPQCETIISSLYAYKITLDEKYLEMHRKIHSYTYDKFPDNEHPEWYGYLHRDGTPAQRAKGNLFKGPFHIPRMMVYSHLLSQEILGSK